MTFTANDLQALVRLLEKQPQSRSQLRTILLLDDLQALPERFDQLTGAVEQLAWAQQRSEERLERLGATVQTLAEAQQRTEERLERLEATVQTLAEAQQRTEERLERLEATVQALAEAQQRSEERLDQLAQAQQRTEERLERLAEAQQRTEERLEQLAQAQQRTEERLEQLAQAQQRTEERLERLEATVQALAEAQQRTEERLEQLAQAQQRTEERLGQLTEEVRELVRWQRGEAGLRAGERYEQLIVKRAPALFNGGEGGATHQPLIQQRLVQLLKPLPALDVLTDEENPFLADLIWWKDNRFLVVEASLKVNGNDVIRAARRAETLQRANVEAMGLVVGEEWAAPDTRRQAEARDIDWKVGDDLSDGLLAFRRLPS